MQTYNAVFDVSIDGPPQSRGKGLSFGVQGKGELPQISITRPCMRDTKGRPLLLFNKLPLNHVQELSVAVTNTGSLPVTVVANLASSASSAFALLPSTTEKESSVEKQLTVKSNQIKASEVAEILVVFKPVQVQQYKAMMWLRAECNQFDNLPVKLLGEGFQAQLAVENLRCLSSTRYETNRSPEVDDGMYFC